MCGIYHDAAQLLPQRTVTIIRNRGNTYRPRRIIEESAMTTEKRWIKPLLADAAACKTKMPWERGLRRQAFIRRRNAAELAQMPLRMRAERQRAIA